MNYYLVKDELLGVVNVVSTLHDSLCMYNSLRAVDTQQMS